MKYIVKESVMTQKMSPQSTSFQYKFNDFLLDPENGLLLENKKPVSLTWRAFKVLELMVKNEGRVIPKKDFMATVWKDSFVEEGNLTVAINSIRKVLHKDGNKFIETFSRRGYRFNGEVEKIIIENEPLQNEISPVLLTKRDVLPIEKQDLESSNADNFVQPGVFNKILNFFSNLTKVKGRN